MFGKNAKKSLLKGDGSTLEIHSLFSTFQGEGPFAGWPSIFIRLAGCNLACYFCDTEFESFTPWNVEALIAEIMNMKEATPCHGQNPLVVITGGEPFRQNITKICTLLHAQNFMVQIETNGTLYRELPPQISIICSPKVVNNKFHAIREDILPTITAFKFIISSNHPVYNNVPDVGQSKYNIPIYLQPMDEYDHEKNRQNTLHTLELAKKYGYRLSLQTHKIWNIE